MSRFLVALAGALALLAVALPGAASSEMIYYVEDFEHNGEPGFDPMFNHEFTAKPGGRLSWRLGTLSDGTAYLFLASGTTDTVTFNLPASATVTYAAVALGYPIASDIVVRFIGSEGIWQSGPSDFGKVFVEITAEQIGGIEAIQLYAGQGRFSAITIGVVPEPTSLVLLLILIGMPFTIRTMARPRRH